MYVRFQMFDGGSRVRDEDLLTIEVDADELPHVERRALDEIVEAYRMGEIGELDDGFRPDGMVYTLRIADGDPVTVVYDDRTLPVDAQPLIELLRDRAIDERMHGRHRGRY